MKRPLLILPRLTAPTNPYVVENPGTSAFSLPNLCSDTISLGGVSPWINPQKLCHPLGWVCVTLTLGLLSCFHVVTCSLILYSLTCMQKVRSHLGALGQNTHPSQGDPSLSGHSLDGEWNKEAHSLLFRGNTGATKLKFFSSQPRKDTHFTSIPRQVP